MHAETHLHLAEPAKGAMSPVGAVLGVALCMLIVFALFWPTTWSMIVVWRTTTFEHCFLVIPISLWLVWRERIRLAAVQPRPFWPALMLIALLGVIWLAAELGGVSAPAHLMLVALIPASVLLVFGVAWARILFFPLAFLFFAAPLGDALIPWLIDRTADFAVWALRLTDIPVYREAAHFVIPSGRWSVVEACSGVRFLIASTMAGSLYAWLMYRSLTKRLLFLLAAIVAPIVANWLRVYVTVLTAHLTNNQWMAGSEHVTFGQILFSAVLLLMFWIGARWREDNADVAPSLQQRANGQGMPGKLPAAFAALLLALVAWPVAAHVLLTGGDQRPVRIVPLLPTGGWKELSEPAANWSPHLVAPAATQRQSFERDGKRVDLWVGVYRNQDEKSKLASSYNRVVPAGGGPWRVLSTGTVSVDATPLHAPLASTRLQGSGGLMVWQWYWLGDHVTASLARAKLDLALVRLTRRSDTSAWVAVATPVGESAAGAQATLSDFLRDNAAGLDAALRATAER
jgi:exosortase A